MKLLHIDTSITGPASVSRQVSAAIVETLKASTPGLEVTHRDLAAQPLDHVTLGHLPGDHPIVAMLGAGGGSEDHRAQTVSILDEFMASDIVVIGAPMYNFTIPSQLKTWIDRILIAGRTFRYTATGPEGLAKGKRVIVAVSRGGYYGPGAPSEAAEHLQKYLRTVFGLIGITDVEFIIAEGLAVGPDHREKGIAAALDAAQKLAVSA
jgi:FMN-dependent NADH-azoreductase